MKKYVPPDLVTLSTYDQVHRAFALLGTKSGTKFGTMFRFTYLLKLYNANRYFVSYLN